MNIEKAKADLQMVGSRIISLDMKNMFVFIANTDENISRKIDVSYRINFRRVAQTLLFSALPQHLT